LEQLDEQRKGMRTDGGRKTGRVGVVWVGRREAENGAG